ncbi:MAG: TetR/AcrR family transcriptional regulator [Gemmatimonadales bacterium]
MKEAILKAAIQVVVQHGLNGWTVDAVARKAGCAKGLINYHYRSKLDLLRQAAEALREDRWKARIAAVSAPPDGAGMGETLDRLWSVLVDEVRSGRFAAWLSLVSTGEPLRAAAANPPGHVLALASSLGRSLDMGEELGSRAGAIEAGLDGLQLRLLMGARPIEVEEDYHRYWLAVIEK